MAKVELDIRAQITNLNKGLDKTEKQLKELQTQSNKTSKTIQKNMGGTTRAVNKLGGALAGVLTIGAAVQFTKAIINVRKEFETFRAVLTNTLGSAIAANREFEKIKQFAASTPFSVRELTNSFVKLVNQGFKPTAEQMRQLGDLAAAVGKDFIQLTEAIIDAQVGEFERLKEFGIRARKEGDLITFTFKEQATVVEFTSKAIQEYILSLGDVEGVSGAMASISETLEGKISNLSDAWETLLDTLGGRTSKIMITAIDLLSNLNEKVTNLLSVVSPQIRAETVIDDFKSILETLGKERQLEELISNVLKWRGSVKDVREEIKKLEEQKTGKIRRFFSSGTTFRSQKLIDAEIESLEALIVQLGIQEELAIQLNKDIAAGIVVLEKQNEEVEVEITTFEDLQKQLKDLNDKKKALNSTDLESIAIKNAEIEAIQNQIKALEKLRPLQEIEPLEEQKDLIIEEGDGILELEKQLNQERLEENEKFNKEFAKSNKERIDENLRLTLEGEQLMFEARAEALSQGLNLIAAANKNNAILQQAIAISQAIINGAVQFTKIGAQAGVLAPPLQIAAALGTLAQIALIRQQKFERGGYEVLKGRRHAQGGIPVGIGQEAEDGEGRAFFTRAATKKHGKFLPAFVKAINEGKTQVTDSGSYNFNFDDSRSVNELKGIRKLLAKAEISYENGFRIETRNGQRTRVRI